MVRHVARSILLLGVSALVGSLVVFLMLRMLSGDVATVILGETATPEALAGVRAELGLDRPWTVQYMEWIRGIFEGDLGRSYAAQYEIFPEIRARLGLTVSLALASLALSTIFALIAGTYSAIHARQRRGALVDVVAQIGIAVPTFWAGLLLVALVSVRWRWLPAGGYIPWSESPIGAVRTLILPVLALSLSIAAVMTRYVRSSMLEILDEDYVRTAMAKGRTFRSAVITHGVRNAAVPIVTVATLQLGTLITGAVVVENVFTLPGLGRMLVSAVVGREAIVVQSLSLVILLIILVLNFVMDIVYGLLDPRIRAAGGGGDRG